MLAQRVAAYRLAPVIRPVAALRAPGGDARVATLATVTPETPPDGSHGRRWAAIGS